MRLLVVSRSSADPSGVGRSSAFARLCGALEGFAEVRRLVGYRGDRPALPPAALAVDLHGFGAPAASLAVWRALREQVRSFRPDAVVSEGIELPAGRLPSVAVVRDLVGTGWSEPAASHLRRAFARRASAVVVPHASVRRDLGAWGVDPFRVVVIPEALPPVVPREPPSAPPLVVVHPGAIHPAKGQHLSIDAVSRLSPSEKERVLLLVAGRAVHPRYLAQLRVAAAGQPVRFLPDPPDLPAVVGSANVAVYPTALEEGCPDAALVCLAHGRPVIGPDRPALVEQLGPGRIPVEPASVIALRDTLREVIAGRVSLAGIGAAGARFVAERHATARVMSAWRTALVGLIRGR